jgi:oxygen-dependent protoporphyrinogen oxidase
LNDLSASSSASRSASREKKVHIVGGGISGLLCAYYASRIPNCRVVLHEKSSRLGGLISTEVLEGYGLIESAANSITRSEELRELCEDLGLDLLSTKVESKKRYIYRKDEAKRWPLTFLETLKAAIFFLSHLFVLKPKKNETIGSWSLRVFGEAFTRRLALPALQGVYANEPSGLSAKLVLSRFFETNDKKAKQKAALKAKSEEPRKQSFSLAPKNGMGEFITALERRIQSNVEIRYQSTFGPHNLAEALARDEKIILCTPLHISSEIVKDLFPAFHSASGVVSYVDMVSVTVFFEKASSKWLSGFGLLFPRQEKIEALGVLFNDDIFENRVVSETLSSETWLYKEELINLTDEQILDLLVRERSLLSKKSSKPLSSKVSRWKKAFPYYDINLERLLEQDVYLESPQKGVLFAGNWTGALSLGKMLTQHHLKVQEFLA